MNAAILRRHVWVGALLVFSTGSAGCESKPVASTSETPATADHDASAGRTSRGPADVARLMNELHQKRDYDGVAEHLAMKGRGETVRLLRALNDVFDADARLRETAARRYGGPHAVAWDLSVLRNNLGIFSAETHVINQSFEGERAIVTMQEGDHVPLVRAPFIRENGAWVYQPDLPPRAMAGELVKLASVLDEIRAAVVGGEAFGPYLESFQNKLVPQMMAVVEAKDASVSQVTAAGETE